MLQSEAYELTKEFIRKGGFKYGDLIVVGCSSSEVVGEVIGQNSNPDVAEEIVTGIMQALEESKLYLAAQCCEHLNRALILEEEVAKARGYEVVNVLPQPKAGGSFATSAYRHMAHPVAVEHVKADGGIDIGDTLIGMHLHDVAVPLRLSVNTLGKAHVVTAKTRLKFIGGERAKYL